MSDPINEIFNGTPDGIDQDELLEMEAANQQRAADAETLKTEVEEKPQYDVAPDSKLEAKQEKPASDQPTQKKGPDRIGFLTPEQHELSTAIGAGTLDWGVDLINLIPGVDIPKLPKFQNDVASSIRDISSVVVPTVGLTVTGVGALHLR